MPNYFQICYFLIFLFEFLLTAFPLEIVENFLEKLGGKVDFFAGFRKIGDMVLKNFEGKYKAVKATCMALKIRQGSGHKWRYVHEKYDD